MISIDVILFNQYNFYLTAIIFLILINFEIIEINYYVLCLIVIPHYLIERFEQSSELKKSFNTDSQSDTLYVLRLLGPLYINNNILKN